jgi:hypothetical protein
MYSHVVLKVVLVILFMSKRRYLDGSCIEHIAQKFRLWQEWILVWAN